MDFVTKKIYSMSEVVQAPSPQAQIYAENLYGRPTVLLPRGIDILKFSPRHRTRTDEEVKLLYVGRIAKEKGVDFFFDAYDVSSDKPTLSDFPITIVGDGGFFNQVDEKIGHIHNVTLTGRLINDPTQGNYNLSQSYANGDIFVYPSTNDTFGNTIQEAMASGLPVVSMNSLGAQFLIEDGETGFIVDSRLKLIERVRFLAENLIERNRIGNNARESVQNRTWKSIFKLGLDQIIDAQSKYQVRV